MQDLSRLAIDQRDVFADQLSGDLLLGRYMARGGQDLRDVAAQFYGDSNEWRRLLSFNLLSSSELSSGQLLLIPTIST